MDTPNTKIIWRFAQLTLVFKTVRAGLTHTRAVIVIVPKNHLSFNNTNTTVPQKLDCCNLRSEWVLWRILCVCVCPAAGHEWLIHVKNHYVLLLVVLLLFLLYLSYVLVVFLLVACRVVLVWKLFSVLSIFVCVCHINYLVSSWKFHSQPNVWSRHGLCQADKHHTFFGILCVVVGQ